MVWRERGRGGDWTQQDVGGGWLAGWLF